LEKKEGVVRVRGFPVGKERAEKRLGSKPQSSALQSGPIFRTARTGLAKPSSLYETINQISPVNSFGFA